jgi:sugar phosphate isomerase/epimerase
MLPSRRNGLSRRLGKFRLRPAAGSSNFTPVRTTGTPGEDHLPWPRIAGALKAANYGGPIAIEAFTPEIREIARAVSIWRPLARSQDGLATCGLKNLRAVFQS